MGTRERTHPEAVLRPTHRSRSHVLHPHFAHPVPAYGNAPAPVPPAVSGAAYLIGAAFAGAVQGVIYSYFLDVPLTRGAKVGAAMNAALATVGLGLAAIASGVAVRPTSSTETPT